MSLYNEYVMNRLRAELDEEEQSRDEASAEDYEAALSQLGVEPEEEA